MRRRIILALIVLAAAGAAIVVAVLLIHARPPAVASLLPAADVYVYLDLATIRRAGVLNQLPKVEFDPEYAAFVRETGFQFERDLDLAAFAVHLPQIVAGSDAAPSRYSEVFSARFDHAKLVAYLRKLAASTEEHRNTNIFVIPLPGRTLRVAILDNKTVAASNTEGPYVIQGMIDRHRQFMAEAPELIRAHQHDVPLGSVAWVMARTAGSPQSNANLTLPGGFTFFVPAGTEFIASVRYLGSVSLLAQAFAQNEDAARRLSDQLSAFLAVYRAVESSPATGANAEVKQLLDSIHVSQDRNRAQLSATFPPGLLKKLLAEPPAAPALNPQQRSDVPQVPKRKSRARR